MATAVCGGERKEEGGRFEAHPSPTAEIKVPTKANVKMTPKFLKKFSYRFPTTQEDSDQLSISSRYPRTKTSSRLSANCGRWEANELERSGRGRI